MIYMKTITLDEIAYTRLKAWKRGTKDSFSQVIRRLVPEPGTLGAFMNFVEAHATTSLPGNDAMEATVEERSPAKHEPWT
jgi:predicted CopG family antitoxin